MVALATSAGLFCPFCRFLISAEAIHFKICYFSYRNVRIEETCFQPFRFFVFYLLAWTMLEPDYVQPELFHSAPSSSEPIHASDIAFDQNAFNQKKIDQNALDPGLTNEPDLDDDLDTIDDLDEFDPGLPGLNDLNSSEEISLEASLKTPWDKERDADLDAELLDESSLKTVLDMLAVLTTVEELSLLETLTDAQKRQVWRATPEALRNELKQIRATIATDDTTPSSSWKQSENPENYHESENFADSNQPRLKAGDWVVLQTHPKLTKAELIAIWEVIEVHGEYARVRTSHLGAHNYPIAWMILYPKPAAD